MEVIEQVNMEQISIKANAIKTSSEPNHLMITIRVYIRRVTTTKTREIKAPFIITSAIPRVYRSV